MAEENQRWFCDYLPYSTPEEIDCFIDGEDYFKKMYEDLKGATEKVFLTGLHFMADFELVRGDSASRLGTILKTVADNGVEVFLLVNQFWEDEGDESYPKPVQDLLKYKEPALRSYLPETYRLFDELGGNDKIHCRTDINVGHLMSTHHQKTVVIDDRIAYLGGIDITMVDGDRWDTREHKLVSENKPHKWKRFYPDKNRRNDADGQPVEDLLPLKVWHDIGLRLLGPPVQYRIDNFHARWLHGQLYKDLKWREEERGSPPDGDKFTPPSHTVQVLKGRRSATNPVPGDRVASPSSDYPPIYPGGRGWPKVHRNGTEALCSYPTSTSDDSHSNDYCTITYSLSDKSVQIVRSMPDESFQDQKPDWNLSGESWERSAKDSPPKENISSTKDNGSSREETPEPFRFDAVKRSLAYNSFEKRNPEGEKEAQTALAAVPAASKGAVRDWLLGEIEPVSKVWPKSEWNLKKKPAGKRIQYCSMLLDLLRDQGEVYDPVRERLKKIQALHEPLLVYRGSVELKIVIAPYAEVKALKVGETWVIQKGREVGEGVDVVGEDLYTPLCFRNLDIASYRFVLVHPDLGEIEKSFPGDELVPGGVYLLSGEMEKPAGIQLRRAP